MARRGRWRVCEEGFPGKPVRRKLGRVDLWLGRLGWLLAAEDLGQGVGEWLAGGGWRRGAEVGGGQEAWLLLLRVFSCHYKK